MKTMVRLHELELELLPHSIYSPDVTLTDFFLFSDHTKVFSEQEITERERAILRHNINRTTKMVSISWKIAIIGVSPSRKTLY